MPSFLAPKERLLAFYMCMVTLPLYVCFFHEADLVFVSYILCEKKANDKLLKLWEERKQHKMAFRFHR